VSGAAGPSREGRPSFVLGVGIFCISAAALMVEVNLTRIFSVSQFYHYAFMIVSLAMLGSGISGMSLALFPRWGRDHLSRSLVLCALGFGISATGAYVVINQVPFDSFSVAWDFRQIGVLALHYLLLSLPFFFSGLTFGLLITAYRQSVGLLYAANMAGSAVGCALALFLPAWVGGEGVVWVGGLLGGATASGLAWVLRGADRRWGLVGLGLIVICVFTLAAEPDFARLRLSPYKGLRYALQYPGARIVSQRWNGFSRVDVVESSGIRSLPGLSFRFEGSLPPQDGLFVDGGGLSSILRLPLGLLDARENDALAFARAMPTAIAYALRPEGTALVLEPRGGLEVWIALAGGAGDAVAVVPNALVVEAVGRLYDHPSVTLVQSDARSFAERETGHYDVVTLALTDPYRPVRSGAYGLNEDYTYTVEAFNDYLAALAPDGILVLNRWLQNPPSESLRVWGLILAALDDHNLPAASHAVALRGYQTMTFLVKRQPFTDQEMVRIRAFADDRAFDLVMALDLDAETLNRHNVLPEPVYHRTFTDLMEADDRGAWYEAYTFDVRPPTDNHPFFSHFFKWSQAPQVLAELGKVWQPFGGAGYFVLWVLLGISVSAAGGLILLPTAVLRRREHRREASEGFFADLIYFGLLGLGYLFVEIPLIQAGVLILGHPAYAFTAVLFAILLFSGIGSTLSDRVPIQPALRVLVILLVILILSQPLWMGLLLPRPALMRWGGLILMLAPVGLLMGMPFPSGLHRLGLDFSHRMPWAFAVNGAASVVASVLAQTVALSGGFTWVLLIGSACYAGACAVARAPRVPGGDRVGSL
jgi:hypothetical protein